MMSRSVNTLTCPGEASVTRPYPSGTTAPNPATCRPPPGVKTLMSPPWWVRAAIRVAAMLPTPDQLLRQLSGKSAA
ncbi:hypothetical protein D3C72_1510430 [compost metagenome]